MRRLNDERGAVLIIVVITMVVLIGMAAFVIDVSAMYQERRELQNGADAAALAIAEDCARELPCTFDSAGVTASTYADANANDNASDGAVDPGDFDPGGRVTVQTTTRTSGGGTAISFLFEPVLDGDADGKTVTASATAIWGAPGRLNTIPLIISYCEWSAATSTDTRYEVAPYSSAADDNDTVSESMLIFHDGSSRATCAAVAGMDTDGDGKLPAGFGWLADDGGCNVTTATAGEDEWVVKDPGVDPECIASQLHARLGTVVELPVFEDYCRSKASGCPNFDKGDKYRVYAYSGFYLTGYDLGGPSYEAFDPATRSTAPDCGTASNDDHCITGYFTRTVLAGGGSPGGPSAGVLIIKLID